MVGRIEKNAKTFKKEMQKIWERRHVRIPVVFGGFTAVFTLLIGLGQYMSRNADPSPCSTGGFPGRCYVVEPHMCELVWSQAETGCREKIRKLNLPPTRLTGPIRSKCQMVKLDQAFSYNRVSNTECAKLREDLEKWKQRNSDFQ